MGRNYETNGIGYLPARNVSGLESTDDIHGAHLHSCSCHHINHLNLTYLQLMAARYSIRYFSTASILRTLSRRSPTPSSTMLSRAELERLSATDIEQTIPTSELDAALQSNPFIPAGVLNLRDIGLVPGSAVRPGLCYRSARLKEEEPTLNWIKENVHTVFDLRSEREVTSLPDPIVDGVKNVWLAPMQTPPRTVLEEFASGDGSDGYREEYLLVLDLYQPIFRAVLEHVRDQPGKAFLFHCTGESMLASSTFLFTEGEDRQVTSHAHRLTAAGRDRTGIVAGLLHTLAGTLVDDIIYDYLLTRVGLEPGHAELFGMLKRAWKIEDPDKAPGWYNFCSLRPTYWQKFSQGVEEKYGGFEGYLTKQLGFSDADLQTIKKNLRA